MLEDFIWRAAGRGWRWGETDCVMTVADWLVLAIGKDPAAPYRGTYHTADEARALWRRLGGFMSVIGDALDGIGLERTQSPVSGDVAIIEVPRREQIPVVGAVLGLRLGDKWAVPGLAGMVVKEFPLVTGWSVPWTRS